MCGGACHTLDNAMSTSQQVSGHVNTKSNNMGYKDGHCNMDKLQAYLRDAQNEECSLHMQNICKAMVVVTQNGGKYYLCCNRMQV